MRGRTSPPSVVASKGFGPTLYCPFSSAIRSITSQGHQNQAWLQQDRKPGQRSWLQPRPRYHHGLGGNQATYASPLLTALPSSDMPLCTAHDPFWLSLCFSPIVRCNLLTLIVSFCPELKCALLSSPYIMGLDRTLFPRIIICLRLLGELLPATSLVTWGTVLYMLSFIAANDSHIIAHILSIFHLFINLFTRDILKESSQTMQGNEEEERRSGKGRGRKLADGWAPPLSIANQARCG